ncbi:hypothetical protein [Allosphingosinicella deserti]|uniref:hypothetical protein n=1 Tax=Allosphingosinicella deserti TaxID=2116704 RepID=UPI001304F69D|nr:hypothetical protein [Sphingomonas deserti]
MTTRDPKFFVQVEQEMPEYGFGAQIDDQPEKRVEATRPDKHLVVSTQSVTIDMVYVVQVWDAKFIEVNAVDVGPDVHSGIGNAGHVRHGFGETLFELAIGKPAGRGHDPA